MSFTFTLVLTPAAPKIRIPCRLNFCTMPGPMICTPAWLVAALVPLLMPSASGGPDVGWQVVESSGFAGPVMMCPFRRSVMFGAPNWMHAVVVIVQVTSPTS